MNMAVDGQQVRPVTKKAPPVHQSRPSGMAREVYALMGERAPPIHLDDPVKYKAKPKLNRKVRPWIQRNFINHARNDKLQLSHWKPAAVHEASDKMQIEGENEKKPLNPDDDPSFQREDEFQAAKFNVRPTVTQYTDEQYNAHLHAEGWTKEETDYLFTLCEEYSLRWIIIGDRYDHKPAGRSTGENDSDAQALTPRARTTEELKARYYNISAKIIALSQPPSTMTHQEFDLYERMSKFDAAKESQRKSLAEKLYLRTSDEAEEEKLLLAELKRIVANEEKFLAQRRELYSRIEFPVSSGNTTPYQTSSGLSQLLQSLLQADKSKKRRSLLGPGGDIGQGGSSPVPTNLHRDSIADTPTAGNKRTSLTNAPTAPNVRRLTPAEELKYGVTHHERLQAGPYFRSERNNKIIVNKPTAMREKITAAIRELNIPPALVMPTAKNCGAFEQLVAEIVNLLEVRKAREKVESEYRVLEAQRRLRLGLPPQEEQETSEPHARENTANQPNGTGNQQQQMDIDVKPELNGNGEIKTEPSLRRGEGDDQDEHDESHNNANGDAANESRQADVNDDDDEDEDRNEDEEEEEQNDDDNQDEENNNDSDAEADVDAEAADASGEEDEEYQGLNANVDEEDDEEAEAEEQEDEDEDPENDQEDEVAQGSDDEAHAAGVAGSDAEGEEEQDEEGDEVNGEEEAEDEEEEEAPPSRVREVQAQAHKRSASVLSAASRGSERKRARK